MPDTLEKILEATRPEEVFGALPDGQLGIETMAETWRTLQRAIHPDRNPDPRASDATARLNELYTVAKKAIETGAYGHRPVVIDPVLIQTRRHAYRVTDLIAQGDCCNVYAATYADDEGERDGLVKIVRDRRNGDLVSNEARVLKTLLSDDAFEGFYQYLPPYKEAFGYRSGGERRPRQGIAFGPRLHDLYTLREVRERYPGGIDPRDAAWMFRRLLMVLGVTQVIGYVHGAVLPEHVLIHPEWHGLVLIDWKYSVRSGETMSVIPSDRREFYPSEVLDKKPVTTATDLYMAACCMRFVMGERATPQIRAFMRGTALPRQSRRPQDAFALKEEYEELIERLWGPRRFRPFSM